jgi:hypothetical protein
MNPHAQADGEATELLTREEVSRLLKSFNPFIRAEEDYRPWSCKDSSTLDCPLLRIWDYWSGSHPGEDGRMLSRAPRLPLDTKEARQTSLANHLDYSHWDEGTPYISFMRSAAAIDVLAYGRAQQGNRGLHTLTVIDPGVRLQKGLPILGVAAEMEYYSIPDPYYEGNRFYVDQYICLWEVTPEEVVGHWEWDEWANNENWYEEIVMPAYREFKEARKLESRLSPFVARGPAGAAPSSASPLDMSAISENLPGQFSVPVNRDQLTSKVVSANGLQALPHSRNLEKGDAYVEFEAYTHGYDSYDTDDEVEESNLNDDILRRIEGGW